LLLVSLPDCVWYVWEPLKTFVFRGSFLAARTLKEALVKKFKEIFDKVLEVIEINISAVLLVVVLVGFILTILLRYILKISFAQIDELIVVGFVWMAMFASPNGTKHNQHVSFTVIYDSIGPRGKAVNDVLFKLILVVLLLFVVAPAWDIINFWGMRRTSMLKLSFKWIYMPYMFFIIFTIYHLIDNLVRDIKKMIDVFKTSGEAGDRNAVPESKE
jgi:TRAP-type C4-dicarboxylate transport system permease small subunit